jgi:N-acetylmuramoyl-L-alanine amidase
VNAYFDEPTRHGVRRLQRRLHLRPDGVVGAHTLTAIVRREPVPVARTHLVVRRSHTRHRLRAHVVRRGETLSGLARRYRTTVAKLARLNHLDPRHYLLIGTKLRIPAAGHRVKVVRTAERTGSVTPVRNLLDRWAAHYGVNRHLVRALAWMESGYNNSLVSPAGAHGIMQLLPTTWSYVETVLIHRRVSHDAAGNIRVGVALIHHLLHVFHGNEKLALAAWYQGEGAVRQHGVYKVSRPFVADVIALSHRM